MIIHPHLFFEAAAMRPAIWAAAELLAEVRGEFDQMQSLVECGIREAEDAETTGGTASPSWGRAMAIGRTIRDLMAANSERLGEAEVIVERLIADRTAMETEVALRDCGCQGAASCARAAREASSDDVDGVTPGCCRPATGGA